MENKKIKYVIAILGVLMLVFCAVVAFMIFVPFHVTTQSVAVIGGADGPTTVFMAGNTLDMQQEDDMTER